MQALSRRAGGLSFASAPELLSKPCFRRNMPRPIWKCSERNGGTGCGRCSGNTQIEQPQSVGEMAAISWAAEKLTQQSLSGQFGHARPQYRFRGLSGRHARPCGARDGAFRAGDDAANAGCVDEKPDPVALFQETANTLIPYAGAHKYWRKPALQRPTKSHARRYGLKSSRRCRVPVCSPIREPGRSGCRFVSMTCGGRK